MLGTSFTITMGNEIVQEERQRTTEMLFFFLDRRDVGCPLLLSLSECDSGSKGDPTDISVLI
jgi:hypothetical protein